MAVKQGWRAECAFACFSFHSPSTPFYHICSVVFNSMTRFYRRPAQLTMELEAKPPLNPLYTPFFTPLGGAEHERTAVINGSSKSFAMTGWSIGWVCAPAHLMEYMLKKHQFGIMPAPTMSPYAAISALRNGDKDTEMMTKSYSQRRRFLMEALSKTGRPASNRTGLSTSSPTFQNSSWATINLPSRA